MCYRYANGDVYEGHYKDGQRHGHGIYRQGQITSTEASVYIGEWVMDKKQGYGVMDDIMKGMILQKTRCISETSIYCIQLCIRPVLFSPYRDLRLIRPVLNSSTLQFSYIILYILSDPLTTSLPQLRHFGETLIVCKQKQFLHHFALLWNLQPVLHR